MGRLSAADIDAWVRRWCSRFNITGDLVPEAVQVGWVAAIERDFDTQAIKRAVDSFLHRELRYRKTFITGLNTEGAGQ